MFLLWFENDKLIISVSEPISEQPLSVDPYIPEISLDLIEVVSVAV